MPLQSSSLTSIALALGLLFSAASADTAKTATAAKVEAPKAPAPATAAPAGPAGETKAPEAPATGDTKVFLAKSGSRYHVKGCRYLKGSSKEITILDAMKQGYAPCNVCKAPHLKRD